MSGTLYLLPLLHAGIFVCLKLVQVMLSETLEVTSVLVLLYLANIVSVESSTTSGSYSLPTSSAQIPEFGVEDVIMIFHLEPKIPELISLCTLSSCGTQF